MPRVNPAAHDSGASSIGMALLFGTVVFTVTALSARAYLTGDLKAIQPAFNSSKSKALDLRDLTSLYTLLYQLTVLGGILSYAYIAEYHPPFPHGEKAYDRDEFMFLTALLFVAASFTVKANDQTAAMADRNKPKESSKECRKSLDNADKGVEKQCEKKAASNLETLDKSNIFLEPDVPNGDIPKPQNDADSKKDTSGIPLDKFVVEAVDGSDVIKPVVVAPVKASCDLVNRDQTEEWKGWMQYMFLLYHYVHAEEVYNSIRVMITCYVWMTGFGNFSFFYLKGDYGFVRLVQMLWRLNFLVVFLCLTQGTTYMLYYICPLHTYFFGMVYVTMSIGRRWNYSKYGLRLKLAVLALGIFLTWDVDTGLFQLLHGAFLGNKPQLGAGSGAMWEWYFRSGLDHWSTFFGMVFAANFPITSLFMRKLEAQSAPKQWLAKGAMGAVMLGAFVAWVKGPFQQPKVIYNATHCFFGLIPLTAYIYFRNLTPKLRSYSLGLLEQIGKTTLETYLMQHHVWLTSDAKTLLTLIPGWPKVNLLVVTILYYLVSRRLYRLTLFLRGMILPDDATKCVQYLGGMMGIVCTFWLMGYGLRFFGMASVPVVLILCVICGWLLYEVVLELTCKTSDESVPEEGEEMQPLVQIEGTTDEEDESNSDKPTDAMDATSTTDNASVGSEVDISRASPTLIGTMVLLFLGLSWNVITSHGASKTPMTLPATCEAAVNNGTWVPLNGCNEYQTGVAYHDEDVSSFSMCEGTYAWGWKKTPSNSQCRFSHRSEKMMKYELERRHITFVGDSMVRNLFHAFRRSVGDKKAGMYNVTDGTKHADMSYTYNDGATTIDFVWAPFAIDQMKTINGIRLKTTKEKKRPDMVVLGGGSWDQLHSFSTESEKQEEKVAITRLADEMKEARDVNSIPVVWLNPTSINTPALQTEEKQLLLKEENMKEMRDLYAQLGVWSASSFLLDGTAFTKDRVEESYDGVHYPFHVYDAGAQILANAMDWVLEDIDESNDFVPPRPGKLANPFLGLFMLIAAAVGLFLFDGFFGVSYVASLFVKGVMPMQLYEEAFTALHKKMKLPSPVDCGIVGEKTVSGNVPGSHKLSSHLDDKECSQPKTCSV